MILGKNVATIKLCANLLKVAAETFVSVLLLQHQSGQILYVIEKIGQIFAQHPFKRHRSALDQQPMQCFQRFGLI
jgi:hypothetical protein